MLSGETSIGQHPVEAVKVMADVALQAEAALPYEEMLAEKLAHLVRQTDDAISYDACRTARQLDASLIIAFTESGGTAARVSKYRPVSPILAMTPREEVQRRLTLAWGVIPIGAPTIGTVEDFFRMGENAAVNICGAAQGDLVVLVAGLPIGVPGGTNLLRVLTISDGSVSG
jgi:pyruvate kinase